MRGQNGERKRLLENLSATSAKIMSLDLDASECHFLEQRILICIYLSG